MSSLSPGDIFEARYRIDGVLGVGGFSRVYDATDLDYERRVAIKVVEPPEPHYVAPTRARFQREVAAVASLESPHTVEVYEYGTTVDGLMYAVFEYIPGRDLAEILIEQGRLQPRVVEHILRQLLESLGEAHRLGILHRDLKPENVRVFERDGDPWHVKLLDFGIARSTDGTSASVTMTGEVVGTPRYMSPEQLTDTELTGASDIYSLGVVAFELLAGRDALHGNGWSDQLDRLRSGYLFSFDDLVDAEALESVIQQMTAFDLEDRLLTAEAVLAALDSGYEATVDEREADSLATVVEEFAPTDFEATKQLSRQRRKTSRRAEQEPAKSPPSVTTPAAAGVRPSSVVAVAAAVVVVGLLGIWLFAPSRRPAAPAPAVRALPDGFLATPRRAIEANPPPAAPAPEPEPKPKRAVAVAPPDGCGEAAPFHGRGTLRFEFELSRKPWHTYIPANYDSSRPVPLLMLLHDRSQDGGDLLTASGFQELSEKHGFVVIAPVDDQKVMSWLDAGDLVAISEIYDETATQLCIDRRRVFLVGQGGAGETIVPLSCADWVAGVATNSFRRGTDTFPCDTPKPRLMLSPLHSAHEPIEGGKNCNGQRQVSLEKAESMWRERNGCEGEPRTTFEYRGSKCVSWTCHAPFESCTIRGGRGWPGGPTRTTSRAECEGPPVSFPTAERVWAFFEGLEPSSTR